VALVETLAYVGDHLSYTQDAVATEAYLGTARRRTSLRRHARLLDYRAARRLQRAGFRDCSRSTPRPRQKPGRRPAARWLAAAADGAPVRAPELLDLQPLTWHRGVRNPARSGATRRA
jgi:hypothetical protein